MSSIAFSQRLRNATQAAHRQAETAPFIRALFAGRVSADAYALTLRQWQALYSALEDAQELLSNQSVLNGFVDPALYRRRALEQDLAWFARGEEWATYPVLPATSAYVARLNDLARREPGLLLAHHYVRYLGDLSGGQTLSRVVSRVYALVDGRGVAFYTFPGLDADRYKASYRQRLDDLNLDDATERAMFDEANLAFQLNHDVFVDLAGPLNPESVSSPATYGAESSASAASTAA